MCDTDQSSTSSHSTSSLLSDLQQALTELSLASARVTTLSEAVTQRTARSSRLPRLGLRHAPAPPTVVAVPVASLVPTSREPLLPGGRICRGDLVRVTNPGLNQPRTGVASYARNRFIYLDGADGSPLHRFESNLKIIRRYDEL